ncbi:MAG: hypothetical protein RLZZ255_136 [Cyanobacteriota bacterium]|jgi:hypothetical protein
MAPLQLSSNTAPILALVGAEIFSLMAFVGVCEARATDIALCESRWSLALPAIALAGQSAATYFMDSGRPGARGPGGGGPDGGMPSPVVRHLPPRNRLGQFRSNNDEDGDDALAA